MLSKLTIKNVALIENAEIIFNDGLNIMSGETGSGKSVVIDALNFALGAKADKTLIRNVADFCCVCAEFDVSNNASVSALYEEFDFEKDDTLIISRKFTSDGKNSVKINGNTVNVSMLKKFTSKLVDVHGQSEHYVLLNPANQLKLLDGFGGDLIINKKEKISEVLREYKSNLKILAENGGDESQRLIRLDVLEYQIKEINECGLKEGEEEELLALREKLLNQEKIINALSSLKSALTDDGGMGDILSNAVRIANGILSFGSDYSAIADRLNSVYAETDDIAETCGSLLDGFEYPEYSLEEIEERLETIKKIKRKYGNTFNEINEFLANAEEEKDKLLHFNEITEKVLKEKAEEEKVLNGLYDELTALRKKSSKSFCEKVVKELRELGMENAKFTIEFSDKSSMDRKYVSVDGEDEPVFMFTANSGEPLKPLSAIISGGELSRFMLAVKAQSAKFDNVSTYIFDEIDAGISGKTATVVAEKLYKISRGVQVVAITHLPQIACFADNSILISKSSGAGKTVTDIKTLNDDEKTNEIIRLVGGEIDSEFARKHAQSLIETAENIKITINNEK